MDSLSASKIRGISSKRLERDIIEIEPEMAGADDFQGFFHAIEVWAAYREDSDPHAVAKALGIDGL